MCFLSVVYKVFKTRNNPFNSIRYVSSLSGVKMLDKTDKTIYIRTISGTEHFEAVFTCVYEPLNILREFNFKRRLSEALSEFVSRIKTNLSKELNKKIKRRTKRKVSETNVDECETEVPVQVLLSKKEVPLTIKCEELFFDKRNENLIQFSILDTVYNVKVNTPLVGNICLPESIMVGYPQYPLKFDLLFADPQNSIFKWYISSDNTLDKWEEVNSTLIYYPLDEHINCKVKLSCIPGNLKELGLEKSVTSSCLITSGPEKCPFELRHSHTSSKVDQSGLRAVSYNILSDMYAETNTALTSLFPYCSRIALGIDYRRQLITKEITGYNADIVCLQEVDEKIFKTDLKTVLEYQNMEGLLCLKKGSREGIATFFTKNKFSLSDSFEFCLADEIEKNEACCFLRTKLKGNDNVMAELTNKKTVLQVAVLSRSNSNDFLVVANTHLHFRPLADHIRLLQMSFCMVLVQNIIENLQLKNPEKMYTLLFCGDFNSSPDCGVYKLMTSNKVNDNFKDWTCDKDQPVEGITLEQPYPMASAYGTPKYTNFTKNFADCLDYIFYQKSNIELIQAVPLPDIEVLTQHTALPSVVFPSDHLALVADFKWINNDT